MRVFRDPVQWGVLVGTGILITVSMMPQARGELVYDEDLAEPATTEVIREEGRETMREVISTSEKARATRAAQKAGPAAEDSVSIFAEPAKPQVEVQNLSRAELLRRERMRQELQNEDLLQERLEALRLKDEEKRINNLFGEKGEREEAEEPAQAPAQPMVLEQEYVTAPGAAAPTGEVVDAMAMNQASAVSAPQGVSTVETSATLESDEEEIQLSVTPRGGVSNMTSTTGYDVQSRFSAGVGLGVGVDDNFSLEAGYSYSEYGVAMTPQNGFVQNVIAWQGGGYYNPNLETVALKQNVFDLGLKMHLLGANSRVRPFLGGGGAYAQSFLNYDQRILDVLRQQGFSGLATDYEISSFLGYLTAGLDVKVSKSLSVGAGIRYYAVLTARENQNLNNMALYNPWNYNPMGYYNSLNDPQKQMVGGSLARSSFYSVLAGVTFTF